MADIAYYDEKVGLPALGFSPDAEFPVINTEKGILQMEARAEMRCQTIVSIQAGTRPNVVPGTAVAVVRGADAADKAMAVAAQHGIRLSCETLEGDTYRLTVTGVPAHASTPWQGVNAASQLLLVLEAIGAGGKRIKVLALSLIHI